MGSDFQLLGQYNEAKEYHEKALIINRQILGDEHPDMASNCYNLGNIYKHLGQYREAKEYHEKALIIKKEIFCDDYADVALIYNNLVSDF